MASFTRRGRAWRAAIKIGATRRTETFSTRAAAVQWAATAELEARAIATNATGAGRAFAPKTLADLLTRYSEEVSEHKAGRRWEQLRLAQMCRDPVAQLRLEQLTSADLGNWRDRRLGRIVRESYPQTPVGAGAVRREMNLLSHALNVAAVEWKWLPESPLKGVRRPPPPPARDRRVHMDELERICHAGGYRAGELSRTVQARVVAAFLFAIENGDAPGRDRAPALGGSGARRGRGPGKERKNDRGPARGAHDAAGHRSRARVRTLARCSCSSGGRRV